MAFGVLLCITDVGAWRDENDRAGMLAHAERMDGLSLKDPSQNLPDSVFDAQWVEIYPNCNQAQSTEKRFCNMFKGFDTLAKEVLEDEASKPKILVVGAGSAGLMAALELKNGGAQVAMIEKRGAGAFIRNNVLALDPMIMKKLETTGISTDLFSDMDDLPHYDNVTHWKKACLKGGEGAELKQDNVNCLKGEGGKTSSQFGFIRTKCLEQKLYDKVQSENIPVLSFTEFVGMAIDEAVAGHKHYAILRGARGRSEGQESPFLNQHEVIVNVDGIVMAVGSSVLQQDRQEFRKWYFVKKTCTSEALEAEHNTDCPEWLRAAHANQKIIKAMETQATKQWPSKSLEASDMMIVHKRVQQETESPVAAGFFKHQELIFNEVKGGTPAGFEGLPAATDVEDLESTEALLVGVRDGDNQVCKNWVRKGADDFEHKWEDLQKAEEQWPIEKEEGWQQANTNMVENCKNVLKEDQKFTKKFLWNLEYHGTKKQSYAMTGLFIPLKDREKSWTQVRRNHAWKNVEGTFEDLSDAYRGKNWLGNQASKDIQQLRLFPNKCLVYVSVGLSNEKAKELMTWTDNEVVNTDAEQSVEHKKKKCIEAATQAKGCDSQATHAAEYDCNFMDSYYEVPPSCDFIAMGSSQEQCKTEVGRKQIAFLNKAAEESGLIIEGAGLVKGMGGFHTHFNINIFKLGPAPTTKEPLFLLGDAAHGPNFLSGCGVVGGQDDSAAVGHYARWLLHTDGEGWPDKDNAWKCTVDMLKVVQNLVFERSCKYSECHEHEELSFAAGLPVHSVQGDARYQGKDTKGIAIQMKSDCGAFMDKIGP